jgi:Arc/MetJ-type ribon-helix-helix transcriptional regulator
MKSKTILITFVAVLALGLAGCSKNEPATPAAGDVNKAVDTTAAAVAKTAEATTTVAVTNAVAVVTTAAAQVTNTAAAMKVVDNSKVQELIDKAKGLVADGKFPDASTVLQQLARQSLTDEQTKLVDGLKDQIQKALAAKAAGNAAGAAGGLLKQ